MIHVWVLDTLPTDILLAPEALEKLGLLPPNWPYPNSIWGQDSVTPQGLTSQQKGIFRTREN